jgi:inorganic pyrophosphatase
LEGISVEPLGWASGEEGTAEVRLSVDRFRSSLGSVRD